MEEGIGSPTQQIFALPARLLQGKGHGPTSFPFYWANSEYHSGIAGLKSSHFAHINSKLHVNQYLLQSMEMNTTPRTLSYRSTAL